MSHASDPDARPGETRPASAARAPDAIRARRPGLAHWIDLIALLRLDEELPDAELRQRDRAIGERIRGDASRPARWLTAWVRARREAGPPAAPGRRTADAVRWSAALLGLLGLLLGAGAALGALSFQPQGRINLVAVLGALVVLPAVLLVMALLNALPTRLRRVLPLVGSEPEGGGWLQPARWAFRALPQSARETLETCFAGGQAVGRVAAPVQRWLLLAASQGAAVAFQVGALAATLALVVFTDLSFGWSTTLQVDPAEVHRVASLLAAPWAWLWPEAAPSLDLVERTRFFRIAAGPTPAAPPELFGHWWRFVVAALAGYGLLPRLVFFGFARLRLRRSLAHAMVDAPGARRLLGRMRSPLVETAGDPERGAAAGAVRSARAGSADAARSRPWPDDAVWVSWSEALDWDAGGPVLAAGGLLAPSEDRATAVRAAELARASERPVAVAVRGFEPPMLELVDFLRELRQHLGDGREIVVGLAHASADDARTWSHGLARVGDPWLSCATDLPAGSASASREAGASEPGGGLQRG